jgi:hypothetical protein
MEMLPVIAMELRHNDEPLGRVCAGAVEPYEDEMFHVEPRFWMGLRGVRARLSFCALPAMRIV